MSMNRVHASIETCRLCPRLVEWRERVAVEKRAAHRDEEYWGRPVPGFGDPGASILVIGLAPAAHGANRTGRMFTGDRSGDFLFASLHRTGFANQAESTSAGDGLCLTGVYVTSAVKCAPPANRPTGEEEAACEAWLVAEMAALPEPRVIVALGGIGHRRVMRLAPRFGWQVASPAPRFGHLSETTLAGGPVVVGSYHPSQQNTFTGRLTPPMLDAVFRRAADLAAFPLSP
jgi:uracil-DNA glycosylase